MEERKAYEETVFHIQIKGLTLQKNQVLASSEYFRAEYFKYREKHSAIIGHFNKLKDWVLSQLDVDASYMSTVDVDKERNEKQLIKIGDLFDQEMISHQDIVDVLLD